MSKTKTIIFIMLIIFMSLPFFFYQRSFAGSSETHCITAEVICLGVGATVMGISFPKTAQHHNLITISRIYVTL